MVPFFDRPYSRLYIVGDNADWVIDEEVKSLKKISETLGYRTKVVKKMYWNVSQIVHYSSQFSLLDSNIYKSRNRISVDYFHGKREHGESYKKCFEMISKHKDKIFKIRVSHKAMKEALLKTGIKQDKIVIIPIGLDVNIFPTQTIENKRISRQKLNIDQGALVIGSFQKDGVGWGEGNEPKLIKGPDIFLKVVEKLKKDFPNLHILLSGPSRGYIKNGLKELGIPYTHKLLKEYKDVSNLYDALDYYLITSREEGGPKACLEAMSKGIPLITTMVGQCQDLVSSGQNAIMTDIEDVQGLYQSLVELSNNDLLKQQLVTVGRKTAEQNSYLSQTQLWEKYFKG